MVGTCVIALLSLAIALYVQARWTARNIRRKRETVDLSGPGPR